MNLWWVIETIWLFLPAYFANASPVLLGGGGPLDGGAKWIDGKPILGSHKTIKGTIIGILAGVTVGVLQGNFVGGVFQAIGAILGDLASSFYKRRIDLKPGESFPPADQLDFIFFAVLLSFPVQNTELYRIIIIILLTIPLHYLANFIAYILKLKENPW
jgi:CDP-2,3-bis-(O-geranylgeranyl)-sn-glycerol synthase